METETFIEFSVRVEIRINKTNATIHSGPATYQYNRNQNKKTFKQ